jgi:hypothetical protein
MSYALLLFFFSHSNIFTKGGKLALCPCKTVAALRVFWILRNSCSVPISLPLSKSKSMDTCNGDLPSEINPNVWEAMGYAFFPFSASSPSPPPIVSSQLLPYSPGAGERHMAWLAIAEH